jgi:hypothetical protein
MNNDATSIDHLFAERHPCVDTQQGENSMQNHTNSEEVVKANNKMKTTSMTPTPLYIFFVSSQSS